MPTTDSNPSGTGSGASSAPIGRVARLFEIRIQCGLGEKTKNLGKERPSPEDVIAYLRFSRQFWRDPQFPNPVTTTHIPLFEPYMGGHAIVFQANTNGSIQTAGDVAGAATPLAQFIHDGTAVPIDGKPGWYRLPGIAGWAGIIRIPVSSRNPEQDVHVLFNFEAPSGNE